MIAVSSHTGGRNDIRSGIQRINEVMSFPPVITELMDAMSSSDVTVAKVTEIVETDPALTAKILRVANSPFYGLRSDVTTIGQAFRLLGLDEIGQLLLTCQMKSRLQSLDRRQHEQLERLWHHSVATAVAARIIASRLHAGTEGKEYTAGLLHDMGKLVLIQYYPEEMATIVLLTESDTDESEAERSVTGMPHTEIGRLVGEKWRLPKEYLDVMQFHHRPTAAPNAPLLTAIVRCADLLAERWEYGIGEPSSALHPDDETLSLLFPSNAPDFDTWSEELREPFQEKIAHFADMM